MSCALPFCLDSLVFWFTPFPYILSSTLLSSRPTLLTTMKTLIILAGTLVHVLGAAVPAQDHAKRGFSLEAKPSNEQRRDFASDWAAAHSRWGSSASKANLPNKSALVDGGELLFPSC